MADILDDILDWLRGQSKEEGFGMLLILGGALYMAFLQDIVVGLVLIGAGTFLELKHARGSR